MKDIREIALTSFYPYGKNKEKIIAERTEQVDKAISEHDEIIRADERAKTIDEFVKSLFANEVIDKSVVRRIAEQMKEHKNG